MKRKDIQRRLRELGAEMDGLDLSKRADRTRLDALIGEEETLRGALAVLDRADADAAEDAEGREWAGLVAGLDARDYYRAAVLERGLSGRAAEVDQERFAGAIGEAAGGVVIPIDLLGNRADTATTLNTSGAPERSMVVGRIFEPSMLMYFGIDMPRVDAGEAKYVAISSGPEAAEKAAGASTDAAETAHAVHELEPKRLVVRSVLRDEDLLRHPGFEDAVVLDDAAALSHGLDVHALEDVRGGLVADKDQAEKVTAQGFLAIAAGWIDGTFAQRFDDIRVIFGQETFVAVAPLLFMNSGATVVDRLKEWNVQHRVTGSAKVIPASASDLQKVLVRRGIRMRDAVCAVWEVARVMRDPYTKLQSGEVAVQITAFRSEAKVLRAGGFRLANVKLS